MRPFTPSVAQTLLGLIIAVAGVQPAVGQGEEAPCRGSPYQAFDFWLGEWEVRLADGTLAGHNTITETAGGCALREEWRSASGGTGESLNLYDAASGTWRQVWADGSGLILRLAGGIREDAMILEGTDSRDARRHRIRWTPLPDGRVRQLWQVSEDEGSTWSEAFDGYYARLPSGSRVDVGSDRCRTPQGEAFDFWPGEWRIESRRRNATGRWHEASGVWKAVRALDGCGFLDFTTADYGSGMMSGVGSRFYDPAEDQWLLTWVSTAAPGKLGVWKGRFHSDGRMGEFYSEEGSAQDGMRTRIRWMDVGADAVSWDYSVSSDGGATWRIHWEMDMIRLGSGSARSSGG